MYFAGEHWVLLNLTLTPLAFPAFIVLPSANSNEVKLFIFGGLEEDTKTKTFTKKSSCLSIISEIDDDIST